jgi:hypothetical protein
MARIISPEAQKRMDFNWRFALHHATICMIERWKEYPYAVERKVAQDLYAHTYDLESEMTVKYGTECRTIDNEISNIFGDNILTELFTNSLTQGHKTDEAINEMTGILHKGLGLPEALRIVT